MDTSTASLLADLPESGLYNWSQRIPVVMGNMYAKLCSPHWSLTRNMSEKELQNCCTSSKCFLKSATPTKEQLYMLFPNRETHCANCLLSAL
jgi:hypothetical protein